MDKVTPLDVKILDESLLQFAGVDALKRPSMQCGQSSSGQSSSSQSSSGQSSSSQSSSGQGSPSQLSPTTPNGERNGIPCASTRSQARVLRIG